MGWKPWETVRVGRIEEKFLQYDGAVGTSEPMCCREQQELLNGHRCIFLWEATRAGRDGVWELDVRSCLLAGAASSVGESQTRLF